MPFTLVEKLWREHVVTSLSDEVDLLRVDTHFFTDLHSTALDELDKHGRRLRAPERTYAIPDHVVSSKPGRTGGEAQWSAVHLARLNAGSRKWGMRYFDVSDAQTGIAHVIGPELGITQPGKLIVCGDSHTCTHGALGALAFGIGASEVVHVLATQTIVARKSKQMRIILDGTLNPGVTAKDLVLHVLAQIGVRGAAGHALEFAGSAVSALAIEERLTLCNMAVEMGARIAVIAPDARTLAYLQGRPNAPTGSLWAAAAADWVQLKSDADAVFDRDIRIDASRTAPTITWGITPGDAIALDAHVPALDDAAFAGRGEELHRALDYMGLNAGQAIAGTRVDRVFIGSCTNGRLTDLEAAAAVIHGRKVAAHVEAWVVPGSMAVKRAAEAAGLDAAFKSAGFQWREPGCSMCVGANGETALPGQRVVSTSNRNFIGRQGREVRTHLASPAVAAECALAGVIAAPAAVA
jgi:3-isopropylmalate/(R)-2-methylmalate dehydratase large subunit